MRVTARAYWERICWVCVSPCVFCMICLWCAPSVPSQSVKTASICDPSFHPSILLPSSIRDPSFHPSILLPSSICDASFSLHGQIGDFGMARDLINDSVYVASGGRVPVKWTALEVSALDLSSHAHYTHRHLHTWKPVLLCCQQAL